MQTLKQVSEARENPIEHGSNSPNTRKSYKSELEKFLLWASDGDDPQEIARGILKEFNEIESYGGEKTPTLPSYTYFFWSLLQFSLSRSFFLKSYQNYFNSENSKKGE